MLMWHAASTDGYNLDSNVGAFCRKYMSYCGAFCGLSQCTLSRLVELH